MKTQSPYHYTVDDYEICVRYEWPHARPEEGCYTARVAAMPGLIYGASTPEAALSICRAELADTLEWFKRDGHAMPHPDYRPPDTYPDALPSPLWPKPLDRREPKAAAPVAAAAVLGRKGGVVKSEKKAASSRRNLLKARAMGKLGGRPKGSTKAKKALAAA